MSENEYNTLREAVFERFSEHLSYASLSIKFNLPKGRIRQAYNAWTPQESQPQSSSDIHFDLPSRGRPCKLATHHEKVIADAVRFYGENNTPLSLNGVVALVEHYVSLLPQAEQAQIGFTDKKPSHRWVRSFSVRNNLSYKRVQQVEDQRVKAVTKDHVSEHIARVQAAMDRFHIHRPEQVMNMDRSGMSFKKMVGRSMRKGLVSAGKKSEALAL